MDLVIASLNQAKGLLQELRPLSLKLEVMEDIYSLLFSMTEDIRYRR